MPEGENPGTGTPTPTPTPAPHPAFSGSPASSGTSLVQITAEEYQRLRGHGAELDTFRSKYATDLAAKETERLTALAKTGEVEKALEQQRTAWEAKLGEERSNFSKVRDLYHGKAKAEALAGPLAGVAFSGLTPEIQANAASQFRMLIQDRFETYEDSQGNLIVREKGTGRPAADVMKELVNAPEYQHFFVPKSRGGSGTNGTLSAGVTQSNTGENPHPMGTESWFRWKAEHANVGVDPLWRKTK
jgi:hypothetical protein